MAQYLQIPDILDMLRSIGSGIIWFTRYDFKLEPATLASPVSRIGLVYRQIRRLCQSSYKPVWILLIQLQIYSMAAGKVLPLRSIQLQTAVGKYLAPGSEDGHFEHRSVLMLNEQCLAELNYQSDQAFTPLIQHQLWQLERQWLYPLRNTLVVVRLQQLALKDSLTDLGNRRHFDDQFERAVQLAHRRKEACALILLDLDNFKQTNDNSWSPCW